MTETGTAMRRQGRSRGLVGLVSTLCTLTCLGCTAEDDAVVDPAPAGEESGASEPSRPPDRDPRPKGRVTLAFVGDMHFQIQLSGLLEHPQGALGPVARTLRSADVTMANLESAVTTRGSLEAKEMLGDFSRT